MHLVRSMLTVFTTKLKSQNFIYLTKKLNMTEEEQRSSLAVALCNILQLSCKHVNGVTPFKVEPSS